VLDNLLGGWEVSGISTYQSGFPFSVVQTGDPNGDGLADRADLAGTPVINSRNPNCYIADSRNPACGGNVSSSFAALPAGSTRFGTSGRNIISGPGQVVYDLGIAKNTRLRELCNVQFRAEFFNLFNRANFGTPQRTVNVTAPMFGTISSAFRSREIQFGLKLEF